MKPHRGTLILVFGILSFVICPLFGIAAWIMGNGDLKLIAAGEMDPAGKDNTKIGKILGMISVALWVIISVISAVITILSIMAAAGSQ